MAFFSPRVLSTKGSNSSLPAALNKITVLSTQRWTRNCHLQHPMPELQSKHCNRVNTFHVSGSGTFKCGRSPTNRQSFCSKGCTTVYKPRGDEEFMLALPTGIVHVSGVARRVLEPGSREASALLLANEVPCPSADYQSLLAHRAHFMHCLQETPPGNLSLQG